ncbi:MAG TPA: type 4a pilus biogenesis protein PilO [Vulgatibacter sp.]|nr:type 4a pilus biogenesis protein PilO [Vulgatibacter sp.]
MEQLIVRIVRAPWVVKIGAVVAISTVLTALNWFVLVDPTNQEILDAEETRRSLEGQFIDKQQIANNLNEYRKQKEVLEAQLDAAMQELPNDKAIDELLRQLNDLGIKSGLTITLVEPQAEVPQDFFARIPVKMKVAGSFHEIAMFFDAVGKLKRIVNVGDLKFGSPKKQSEKVVLDAEFVATTFRFREKAPEDTKKKPSRRRGRK